MTDEQINLAISEACGWKEVEPWLNGDRCFELNQSVCGYRIEDLPDYCSDLNAMHEAENILQRMTFEFTQWLLEIVSRDDGPGTWYASGSFAHVHSTARQRAEAFLRALGKWEGGK